MKNWFKWLRATPDELLVDEELVDCQRILVSKGWGGVEKFLDDRLRKHHNRIKTVKGDEVTFVQGQIKEIEDFMFWVEEIRDKKVR